MSIMLVGLVCKYIDVDYMLCFFFQFVEVDEKNS